MMFDMKGQGMPGPAMAMRIMEMMMGGKAGEAAGDDLVESVVETVSRATEGMTDEEYGQVVEEIGKRLSRRSPGPTGCC